MKMRPVLACACAGLLLALFAGQAAGQDETPPLAEPPAEAAEQPRIDVVFVLDTTGSMGGLIQTAKEKIWSIANTMARSEPTPRIRIGLVGYRDRGDAYVTRVTGLSEDLDAVYADLMAFEALGGGDTPESVNQALYEAVNDMSWSADGQTYRVIFLVGDCPPHMDYEDDVPYAESCRMAIDLGIHVNTIQCGGHGATTPVWKEIASKGEGGFFHVAQDGGAVLGATPHDERLAELSRELDGTRLWYGDKTEVEEAEKREKAGKDLAEKATASALAQRARFNSSAAGAKNFRGCNELVFEVTSKEVRLDEIDQEALPESLRALSAEEREARVRELAQKRAAIMKEIRAVDEKRQAWLRARAAERKEASLEQRIHAVARDQAADEGIALPRRPSF